MHSLLPQFQSPQSLKSESLPSRCLLHQETRSEYSPAIWVSLCDKDSEMRRLQKVFSGAHLGSIRCQVQRLGVIFVILIGGVLCAESTRPAPTPLPTVNEKDLVVFPPEAQYPTATQSASQIAAHTAVDNLAVRSTARN